MEPGWSVIHVVKTSSPSLPRTREPTTLARCPFATALAPNVLQRTPNRANAASNDGFFRVPPDRSLNQADNVMCETS